MNDLESRLQDALDETAARVSVSDNAWLRNEQLLHELPRRRSRTTWMVLATAACVVGVLIAVVILALPGGSDTPPAVPPPTPITTPTGTPTPSAPTPSGSPASAPSAGTTSPAISPPANVVTIGGASLTLPSGWVAEAIPSTDQGGPILPSWCLMPKAGQTPSSEQDPACTISFSAVRQTNLSSGVSVDTEGGLVSNPEYCGPGSDTSETSFDYADTEFGTRPADYRRWLFVCKDGTRWQVEQYVADNAPGYILFSEHATDDVHKIMAQIAAEAQLPEISAPLRLSDFGIVRSVNPISGGYHVLIDRVVQGIREQINKNPQTYAYDVPTSALPSGGPPEVGKLIELTTNGDEVTSFVTMR